MGGKEAKMGAWEARQGVHMKPEWQGWKPGWQDRELGTKETNGSAREQGCLTAALPLLGLQSLALLKKSLKSLCTALQCFLRIMKTVHSCSVFCERDASEQL